MKPFFFPGGSTGCLLIHGFTGTPAEMLPLGEYLARRGLTVSGIRLAGHGTVPAHLRGIRYRHWLESATTGLADLTKKCNRVFVVGFSMGGTIALHLAAGHRVDGLVTICTPLVFDLKFYTTRTASLFLNFKSETKQNIKNPAARKDHIAYSSVPPGAFFQLLALLGATRSRLDRITVPVLLFQSSDDRIVSPTNAPYLYRQLTGTDKKELVWLNNSGHMATLDYDKTIIFENTLRLIKEI